MLVEERLDLHERTIHSLALLEFKPASFQQARGMDHPVQRLLQYLSYIRKHFFRRQPVGRITITHVQTESKKDGLVERMASISSFISTGL